MIVAPPFLLSKAERDVLDEFRIENCDRVFDGMCLWETILDGAEEPAIESWLGSKGMMEARLQVASWIDTCNLAWEIAREVYDYDECYDYEFCPWFVKHCLNPDTMKIREDWLYQVRNIEVISRQDQMDAEGWALFDGDSIQRLDEKEVFENDFEAWVHVLQKAIVNRNPTHLWALKKVREENPQEYLALAALAWVLHKKDLSEVLNAP